MSWENYAAVALLSGLKFVPGVAAALAMGMNFWETTLSTGLGGVAGASFFAYFGNQVSRGIGKIRARYFPRRKAPKPPRTTLVQKVWMRYGLPGVAALTPPLFSPPIGTAIAVGFGTPPAKIVAYMSVSFAVWAPLAGTLALFDYRSMWHGLWS
ncbi:MAG: hypothetical protein RMM53_04360 [Bacteroidia bacterium]|nr:hypothetical protein [Bacteroidia bacterium]MDW8333431.1 hypothetical protein [Bacteroidia bacterium]